MVGRLEGGNCTYFHRLGFKRALVLKAFVGVGARLCLGNVDVKYFMKYSNLRPFNGSFLSSPVQMANYYGKHFDPHKVHGRIGNKVGVSHAEVRRFSIQKSIHSLSLDHLCVEQDLPVSTQCRGPQACVYQLHQTLVFLRL